MFINGMYFTPKAAVRFIEGLEGVSSGLMFTTDENENLEVIDFKHQEEHDARVKKIIEKKGLVP